MAALALAVAAAMPSAPLGAQDARWRIGLEAGVTAGTLSGSFVEEADPVLGAAFSGRVERWLGPAWVVAATPGLVQRGAGGLPVGSDVLDYRLTYLDLPVTVSRTFPVFGGRWRVGPHVGAALGWLSDCGVRHRGQSRYTSCDAATPGGEAGRLDPSLTAGITLRRRYSGGARLLVDLRYAPSLAPVLDPTDLSARSHLLQARFGFTLPLDRAEAATGGLGPLVDATEARGRGSPAPFCCDGRRFGPAARQVLALQIVPWYFNRHFSDDSTAVLSLDSWWRNIEQGFAWDADHFDTNMFMHPFHGSTFYNAARSNGYSFWESAAFPWVGSFLWEFFGENVRPSINDWANTSASGVVMGEALHRTARVLRDNSAHGSGRTFRELAGFVLDPVGGLNRLLRGEMSRVGPNPGDRMPAAFGLDGKLGLRVVGEGELDVEAGGATPFFELAVQYGDPFTELRRPFDDFLVTVQINDRDKEVLGRLQVEGPLYRTRIARSDRSRHFFGLGLHYDYINNETYELGGQSLSAGIGSEIRLSDRWTLHGRTQLLGTFIAGVDSEYAEATGRDYDFGSGAGLRAYATLRRGDDRLVEAFYVAAWIHTLGGASGDHVIQFPEVAARIPVIRPLGLGVEIILAARDSYYDAFPDVHRRNPQFRVFATLMP